MTSPYNAFTDANSSDGGIRWLRQLLMKNEHPLYVVLDQLVIVNLNRPYYITFLHRALIFTFHLQKCSQKSFTFTKVFTKVTETHLCLQKSGHVYKSVYKSLSLFTKARGGYIYVFGERSDHCPEGAVAQSAITITKSATRPQIVTSLTRLLISYLVRRYICLKHLNNTEISLKLVTKYLEVPEIVTKKPKSSYKTTKEIPEVPINNWNSYKTRSDIVTWHFFIEHWKYYYVTWNSYKTITEPPQQCRRQGPLRGNGHYVAHMEICNPKGLKGCNN